MLTLVEVRNVQGDVLSLPLNDSESGILLQGIEGLDPVKATIVSSSFATLDGGQYHASRREMRNIKFNLGLEAYYTSETIRDVRKKLYPFFMPKSWTSLRFYDSDGPAVDIEGRVESFETPLFAKEPEADISILCMDPDFIDPTLVTADGNTTASAVETEIEYEGSVDTGVKLIVNANRSISEFTVYLRTPDQNFHVMDVAVPMVSGDKLTINTKRGEKSAILTHAGADTSVLYGITPQSDWFVLQPGTNYIRVYATGAAIPYDLEYTNRYGGL